MKKIILLIIIVICSSNNLFAAKAIEFKTDTLILKKYNEQTIYLKSNENVYCKNGIVIRSNKKSKTTLKILFNEKSKDAYNEYKKATKRRLFGITLITISIMAFIFGIIFSFSTLGALIALSGIYLLIISLLVYGSATKFVHKAIWLYNRDVLAN